MRRTCLRAPRFNIVATLLLVSAIDCRKDAGRQNGPSPSRDASATAAALPADGGRAPAKADLSLVLQSDVRGVFTGPSTAVGPTWVGDAGPGLARRAAAIDDVRVTSASTVVLDAGDLFAPPAAREAAAAIRNRVRLGFSALARMGVAAFAPGESDLTAGWRVLRDESARAHVPIVLANLESNRGARVFPDRVMIEAGGHHIGVFGLLVPTLHAAQWVPETELRVTDAVPAARQAVVALRAAGCDVVVALAHAAEGEWFARRLASEVPGIDVVALGHPELPSEAEFTGPSGVRTLIVGNARAGRSLAVAALGGEHRLMARHVPVTPATPEQFGTALLFTVAAGEPPGFRRKDPPPENWTYSSNGGCELCHAAALAHWRSTAHAEALDTLIDSKKADDPACLGCHMTAFLQPGGTHFLATSKQYFANVGCESCHGPSAVHVRARDKHTGTVRKVPERVCLGCHTPDQTARPFDYSRSLAKVLGPGHGAAAADPVK